MRSDARDLCIYAPHPFVQIEVTYWPRSSQGNEELQVSVWYWGVGYNEEEEKCVLPGIEIAGSTRFDI